LLVTINAMHLDRSGSLIYLFLQISTSTLLYFIWFCYGLLWFCFFSTVSIVSSRAEEFWWQYVQRE